MHREGIVNISVKVGKDYSRGPVSQRYYDNKLCTDDGLDKNPMSSSDGIDVVRRGSVASLQS